MGVDLGGPIALSNDLPPEYPHFNEQNGDNIGLECKKMTAQEGGQVDMMVGLP
jgi:hypothetical protein